MRTFSLYLPKTRPPPPGLLVLGGSPAPIEPVLPIVFIHGLGVGVAPYLRFIRRLAQARECFVIDLPEVSQSGCERVLSPQAMAECIAQMLSVFGHEKACFVAHSYGTFVMSWIIRYRRDIVGKTILLDPVSFLLAQPDVAYNFLYRDPHNPVTVFIANFVRWELFSANVLMRHFYWHENVLWSEDLPENSVVVLASNDDIIDAKKIRYYLEERQREGVNAKIFRKTDEPDSLKLLWLEGFYHGGILLSRAAQLQIVECL